MTTKYYNIPEEFRERGILPEGYYQNSCAYDEQGSYISSLYQGKEMEGEIPPFTYYTAEHPLEEGDSISWF